MLTRDTVLLAGDDTDDAAATALGLDVVPYDGLTLGELVDDLNDTRRVLEHLIWELTGGALSKATSDPDLVREAAQQVCLRDLAMAHPALVRCEAFRDALREHASEREVAGLVAAAERKLARVTRVGPCDVVVEERSCGRVSEVGKAALCTRRVDRAIVATPECLRAAR